MGSREKFPLERPRRAYTEQAMLITGLRAAGTTILLCALENDVRTSSSITRECHAITRA